MYLVRIAQLEPGQRLAKAVTNANGAVLCPAGFELTESAIARLRNAGVESVVLEGGSSNADAIKERIGALDARFEGVTDPAMIRIKETVENRLRSMLPREES
ncbi:MAG: hypothetical protein IT364_20035 [Candidatus Hydrogenedentes bacterium]|nr:hypothetical protein [Candidatus Hydrogenedentota bacterium]